MTLAELVPMSEQRIRHNWTLVSFLLAMIHNMHVARKQDVRAPSFFNPYASCSNDVMEINRNEAKELFSLIAQKCGGVVNAIQP